MRLTIAGLSMALLTATVAAQAPHQQQPPRQDGQQTPQFDAKRYVKDHDKNGDGKLTKDELPKRMQGMFAQVDLNGDGSLSVDELAKHAQSMGSRRPQMVDLVYYVIDVPAPEPMDGQELQEVYSELRQIDANNDGKLDKAEIAAYRLKRRKERLINTFEELDRNNDKKISKDEARGVWADDFDKLDANHNGSLDEKEIEAAYDLKADAMRTGEKK